MMGTTVPQRFSAGRRRRRLLLLLAAGIQLLSACRGSFSNQSAGRVGGDGGNREIPQPKKNIQVQRRSEEKDGGGEIMCLFGHKL